jgi:hypothetical protein
LPERDIQHDVRSLAAHSRQLLQRLAIGGDLAAMLAQQDLRERDDVLRLVAIEPDRLHVRDEAFDAELDHRGRRSRDGKELLGGLVHAFVRRLRGKHDRHQELERRLMLELRARIRIGCAQPLEDRAAFLRIQGLTAGLDCRRRSRRAVPAGELRSRRARDRP